MQAWFHHDHHGRWGRSQLYTDQTICTFLMLEGIFNLILRTTQGLLDPPVRVDECTVVRTGL
ncbi:transposase [Aeromonas veronii]|uniref:transposase n=1 Tax=Aeromonas veronii TaxID=654 RepID=UPI0038D4108E